MAYAKESVSKSHTCHCSRIGHLLSRLGIVGSVVVGSGQILKYHLKRLQCNTVRIICSHNRSNCLEVVRYGINTRCACKALGSAHMKVCINDCHVRKQFVISQRIFNTCCFISNYCKRCNFRTGTCRCGDGNEECLFPHLGEFVNSLSDIHETHCHIKEICFGMFI